MTVLACRFGSRSSGSSRDALDRHPLPSRRRRVRRRPRARSWQRARARRRGHDRAARRSTSATSTRCGPWRTSTATGLRARHPSAGVGGAGRGRPGAPARRAGAATRRPAPGGRGRDRPRPLRAGPRPRTAQSASTSRSCSWRATPGCRCILHVRRSADELAEAAAPDRGARRHRACVQRQRGSRRTCSSSAAAARLRRRDDVRPRAADPARWRRTLPARCDRCWRPMRPTSRRTGCTAPRTQRARGPDRAQRAGRAAAHRADARRVARLVARRTTRRTAANARAALPRLPERLMGGTGTSARAGRRALRPDGSRSRGSHRWSRTARACSCSAAFPAWPRWQAQQYYAHPRNQFWTILSTLWGVDLRALPYAAAARRVRRAGPRLWDVYASCRREGSLDSAIEAAQPNDLAALQRLPAAARDRAQRRRIGARHERPCALGVRRRPPAVDQPGQRELVASNASSRPGARCSSGMASHDGARPCEIGGSERRSPSQDGVRYLHLDTPWVQGAMRIARAAQRWSSSTCSA